MKVNKWTLGLAAVGLVSLPSVAPAEEQMSPVNTALASTVISGYVNTAAQWDFGTGNAGAPAYAYNSGKQDGFSLNAVKLSIEKPLDESQWAAGYKIDLMFGQDANTFRGTALLDDGFTDVAMRQAYVALRAPVGNGLDFKMGVFDTIIGYESHDAGNNPNYTRSYGYSMEPLSHTGLLTSYRANDMFSASFGIANTVGPLITVHPDAAPNRQAWPTKAESYKTYMGSLTFTAPESMGFLAGSTLYGGIVNGFNGSGRTEDISNGNQTHYYIGSTVATPIEGFRFGAAFDYLCMNEGFDDWSETEVDGAWAWAISGYLTYQATEKLSLHGRGEYFTQADELMRTGLPSKIFALTATVQYDLWQNVLTRLEFRWDHQADGSTDAFGDATYDGDDFVGDGKRNSCMIAANVIYKF